MLGIIYFCVTFLCSKQINIHAHSMSKYMLNFPLAYSSFVQYVFYHFLLHPICSLCSRMHAIYKCIPILLPLGARIMHAHADERQRFYMCSTLFVFVYSCVYAVSKHWQAKRFYCFLFVFSFVPTTVLCNFPINAIDSRTSTYASLGIIKYSNWFCRSHFDLSNYS